MDDLPQKIRTAEVTNKTFIKCTYLAYFVQCLWQWMQGWCQWSCSNFTSFKYYSFYSGFLGIGNLWRRACHSRLEWSKCLFINCLKHIIFTCIIIIDIIGDNIMAQFTWFRYLGFIFQSNREINSHVKHGTEDGWMKWKKHFMCNLWLQSATKLKRKLLLDKYHQCFIIVKVAYWTLKQQEEPKKKKSIAGIEVDECSDIQKWEFLKVRVAPIKKKLTKAYPGWFDHVRRGVLEACWKNCKIIQWRGVEENKLAYSQI